jgi:hypothetical protein
MLAAPDLLRMYHLCGAHTHTHTHTHTHSHTYTHKHTHSHTHTHTNTHAYIHRHLHAHTPTHTHARLHTQTLTRTHTLTHTLTHTSTTHILTSYHCSCCSSCPFTWSVRKFCSNTSAQLPANTHMQTYIHFQLPLLLLQLLPIYVEHAHVL